MDYSKSTILGDRLGLSGRLCQQLNPARHQPGNKTPPSGIYSDSHGSSLRAAASLCCCKPAHIVTRAKSQELVLLRPAQGNNLNNGFRNYFVPKTNQIPFYYFFLASATILSFGLRLYFERWPPLLFRVCSLRYYFELWPPLVF